MKGNVKMFNPERGFGFITGEDGKDTYFHKTAVEGGATISVGDSVEYEIEQGERGARAKSVRKL